MILIAIEDEIFDKASSPALPNKKILSGNEIKLLAEAIKGYKSVFTNGCFDLLHIGHVQLIQEAARQGDRLIVAVNSDASVKRLKGPERPIQPQAARALVMAGLDGVDAVTIFDEDTPLALIEAVTPDVLVKGGDYDPDTIVGAAHVRAHGGRVHIAKLLKGFSTTGIVKSIA